MIIHIFSLFTGHVHADKMNRRSKQMAPRGPLREQIPMHYHAFVSTETLNSYLVNSYKEEIEIYNKHPEITSVIVKKYTDKLYEKVRNSLNERGADASLEMDAWLINTLVDEDNFDECIRDMPDQQPEMNIDDNYNNTKSDMPEDDLETAGKF